MPWFLNMTQIIADLPPAVVRTANDPALAILDEASRQQAGYIVLTSVGEANFRSRYGLFFGRDPVQKTDHPQPGGHARSVWLIPLRWGVWGRLEWRELRSGNPGALGMPM